MPLEKQQFKYDKTKKYGMVKDTGWKPIPLSLKIVFVLSILWVIGSFFAIQQRYELGVPLLGTFVYGISAVLIVLLLDIIGPLSLLYAVWNRKAWGPKVASSYMGFFIINSLVSFVSVGDKLGGPAILVPAVVDAILLLITYNKRSYFN